LNQRPLLPCSPDEQSDIRGTFPHIATLMRATQLHGRIWSGRWEIEPIVRTLVTWCSVGWAKARPSKYSAHAKSRAPCPRVWLSAWAKSPLMLCTPVPARKRFCPPYSADAIRCHRNALEIGGQGPSRTATDYAGRLQRLGLANAQPARDWLRERDLNTRFVGMSHVRGLVTAPSSASKVRGFELTRVLPALSRSTENWRMAEESNP
jgi:hypothetical protein